MSTMQSSGIDDCAIQNFVGQKLFEWPETVPYTQASHLQTLPLNQDRSQRSITADNQHNL